jgi:hypothetical protein
MVLELKNNPKLSELGFTKRYNLKYQTVRDWRKSIEHNITMNDQCGQPKYINKEIKDIIIDKFNKKYNEKDPFTSAEGETFICETINTHRISKGLKPVEPCQKTLHNIKEDIGIKDVVADVTTDARLIACSDMRNSFSMWVMLSSLIQDKPPELIWNYDATNLKCEFDGHNKIVSVVQTNKIHPTKVGDCCMDLFVKWIHLACADGHSGPIILLFCLETLQEDSFHVIEVNGLNYSSDLGAKGYVCFCRTRAGNMAFFNWFISTIVIPTITISRSHHGHGQEQGFVYCDGEAVTLSQVFSENLTKLAQDNHVHIGKLPASCSGIHQSCDVSPVFKVTKKCLKDIFKRQLIHNNPTITTKVQEGLSKLESDVHIIISALIKQRIETSVLAITTALQMSVNPQRIRDGFRISGQYPLSFDIIMGRCYYRPEPTQMNVMREKTDDCVSYFMQHGQLTEEFMDSKGICSLNNTNNSTRPPHDLRPIHQQRAVLLTNTNTISRYHASINSGLSLGAGIANIQSSKAKNEAKKLAKSIQTEKAKLKREEQKQLKVTAVQPIKKQRKRKSAQEIQDEAEAKQAKKRQRLDASMDKIRKAQQALQNLGVAIMNE